MANTQMSTPINSLPLKTTQEQAPPIDDPLIQNVLKEFEDEYNNSMESEPEVINEPMHVPSYTPPVYQQQNDTSYPLEYEKKELFRTDLVKKGAMLTILILVLQKSHVLDAILKYAPEYLQKHISGNEYVLYSSIVFVTLYAILYLNIL